MKKILVLGGHGFVGSTITRLLEQSCDKVYALSRSDGLDLTHFEATKECFTRVDPDVVVNCAAMVGSLVYVSEYAAEVLDTNLRMLVNIYRAAHECTPSVTLINPIANCAFPASVSHYREDELWQGPIHPSVLAYGSTRRMMLVLSECYSMEFQLRCVNLIVPNMYGPYDSTDPSKAHALNALIGKVVKAQREGVREIEVWGSGKAVREWLFAPDCARVFAEVIARLDREPAVTEPVSIAQNFGLSVRELIHTILSEAQSDCAVRWNTQMPDGAPCKIMDDTRFRKYFPNFQFTSLSEGIRRTIEYYQSVYPY